MTTKNRHLHMINSNDPRFYGPITRMGLKRGSTPTMSWIVFFASQLILIAAMTYYFVY